MYRSGINFFRLCRDRWHYSTPVNAGPLAGASRSKVVDSMDDCCETKAGELDVIRSRHGRVLGAVLAVNALMFIVEFWAGLVSGSSALLADSLDMLGDSFVYGFSLFVVHRSLTWKARAALLKGGIMALFGVAVLFDVAFKLRTATPPEVPTMAAVGMLALGANALCFMLLWRHRADDINLRSTWLCSRNDLIANGAVLAAAVLVAWSGSGWPDILVGLGIAALFLRTAAVVLRESFEELGRARHSVPEAAG
jgi:cation diffusion facilitator family transporter